MKLIDIVKLKTSIVMFKASKNTLTNNKNCFFLSEDICLSEKKLELIEHRFVFQLLANN